MIIRDSTITARQAADRFASDYGCGYKIGVIAKPPHVGMAGLIFQFVNGVRWYAVTCLPDYSGWEITVE